MPFGGSFSRLLDKVKHPATKGKRKSGRRESSITGMKVDPASSVTRPGPHVAEASNNREGNGTGVEGSQNGLRPDVEVGAESVPSREESGVDEKKVDQIDPLTSTPSILHDGEPDSMWTNSFQFLPLTVLSGCSATPSPPLSLRLGSPLPSGDVETSTVPDHVQDALSPDQSKPAVADQDAPTVVDESEPTISDRSEQTAADQNEPTVADQSKPIGADQDKPTVADEGEPAGSDRSEPTVADQDRPTVGDESEPTVADKNESIVADQNESIVTDQNEPTVAEQSEPTIADQSKPTDADQDKPTIADQDKQTVADEGEPTIEDQNESTVADQNGPTIADDGEPTGADQSKPDQWKFATYPTTKLFHCGVKESADASDPLRSVVAGLCFILENCKVCPSPRYILVVTLTGAPAKQGG
jgi:hypothetical protein